MNVGWWWCFDLHDSMKKSEFFSYAEFFQPRRGSGRTIGVHQNKSNKPQACLEDGGLQLRSSGMHSGWDGRGMGRKPTGPGKSR